MIINKNKNKQMNSSSPTLFVINWTLLENMSAPVPINVNFGPERVHMSRQGLHYPSKLERNRLEEQFKSFQQVELVRSPKNINRNLIEQFAFESPGREKERNPIHNSRRKNVSYFRSSPRKYSDSPPKIIQVNLEQWKSYKEAQIRRSVEEKQHEPLRIDISLESLNTQDLETIGKQKQLINEIEKDIKILISKIQDDQGQMTVFDEKRKPLKSKRIS